MEEQKPTHNRYSRREQLIRERCQPLHPHLFTLAEDFLSEEFLNCVKALREGDSSLMSAFTSLGDDLYSFSMFNETFAQLLIEEIEHYLRSDAPKASEIVMEELGFNSLLSMLVSDYLMPVIRYLYPEYRESTFTDHYCFVIKNIWGESDDFQLWRYIDETGNPTTIHTDDSDVTVNICLGISFQGSQLRFYGVAEEQKKETREEENEKEKEKEKEKGNEENEKEKEKEKEEQEGNVERAPYIEYQQQPGRSVIHFGLNRHEVFPIHEGGIRYNLVLWCRK